MKKSIKEPKATIKDVLSAVNNFADEVKKDMNEIKQDLKGVKDRLSTVESTINTQMVTKTYLDEAFATFGLEQEKKHQRVNTLTTVLTKKKILNQSEAQTVLSI